MTNQLVQVFNGEVFTSSRNIAENFNKEHKYILRDIKNYKEKISPNLVASYFIENTYKDSINRNQTEYLLTRDGFSLLVMGFTGKKALEWKLKYIEAFNKMEETLKNQMIKLDSYMIEDPIERALRWVEEQKQAKLLLEQKQQVIDTIVEDKTTFEQFNKQIITIMNRVCSQKSAKLSNVYNEFYYYLNMKLGINVILRVNNRRDKLNKQYFEKTGKQYSERTLRQKVTGLKVIREEEYNEVLQIAKAWAVKLGVNIVDLNKLN